MHLFSALAKVRIINKKLTSVCSVIGHSVALLSGPNVHSLFCGYTLGFHVLSQILTGVIYPH